MVRCIDPRVTALVLSAAAALPCGLSCKPAIEGRPSLIDRSRVIAIKSVPAEQAPGKEEGVDFTALFVSPDADATPAHLQWSLCNARKALADILPAAKECLAPSGKGLEPIGLGDTAHAVINKDDCSVFGPAAPMAMGKQATTRPADPDTTGGYYQPVRVLVPTEGDPDYVVGVTRLACGIGSASQEQTFEFADQYRPNENPAIDTLVVRHPDKREDSFMMGDGVPNVTVARGERVTFLVTWKRDCPLESTCGDMICGAGEYAMDRMVMGAPVKGCPGDCMMPKGCTGSEPYVQQDPVSRQIVPRREAMRVSWFATDGNYDHDRTGRTEAEAGDPNNAFSDNDWTAPITGGKVRMWAVLRDDRGGVGWAELSIDVGG